MKFLAVSLFLSIAWLPPAALAKKAADYPATYAGGSLPLNHQKVRTALGKDEMIFVQGARRIAVPVKSITEISCGTEVRHPLMHLGKGQDHYVGVAWVGAGGTGVSIGSVTFGTGSATPANFRIGASALIGDLLESMP